MQLSAACGRIEQPRSTVVPFSCRVFNSRLKLLFLGVFSIRISQFSDSFRFDSQIARMKSDHPDFEKIRLIFTLLFLKMTMPLPASIHLENFREAKLPVDFPGKLERLSLFKYLESTPEGNPYGGTNPISDVVQAIASISDPEGKTDQLIETIERGDWNRECWNAKCTENVQKAFGEKSSELSFIALYALVIEKITLDDFVQAQLYASLRHQFHTKAIGIIKPASLSSDKKDRWVTYLRWAVQKFSPYPGIAPFTDLEFDLFLEAIAKKTGDSPGKSVFFAFWSPESVQDQKRGDIPALCSRIKALGYHFFMPLLFKTVGKKRYSLNIACPLFFYEEALKILFPNSFVRLKPRFFLTPIERQYNRSRGICDVLVPLIFVPHSLTHRAFLDGSPVPGAEAFLHDIYHALLISALPIPFRNYLFDYAKAIVEKPDFAAEEFAKKGNPVGKKTISQEERKNIAALFRAMINDSEYPSSDSAKSLYPNGVRIPVENAAELFVDILKRGGQKLNERNQTGQKNFFSLLACDRRAPWNTTRGKRAKIIPLPPDV